MFASTSLGANSSKEIKRLVEKGANVNKPGDYGETVLFDVANRGDLDLVQFLLQHGADINHKSRANETALFKARRHPEIFKFLVENGCDTTCITRYDKVDIMYMLCTFENVELATYLLDKGLDIHRTFEYNTSYLDVAAKSSNLETVKLLLSRGAVVSRTDDWGNTPLHKSLFEAINIDVVKFLIANGADVNHKNNEGKSPLDIAKEWDNGSNDNDLYNNGSIYKLMTGN
jgi:ankyrin repeat protein